MIKSRRQYIPFTRQDGSSGGGTSSAITAPSFPAVYDWGEAAANTKGGDNESEDRNLELKLGLYAKVRHVPQFY